MVSSASGAASCIHPPQFWQDGLNIFRKTGNIFIDIFVLFLSTFCLPVDIGLRNADFLILDGVRVPAHAQRLRRRVQVVNRFHFRRRQLKIIEFGIGFNPFLGVDSGS